MSRIGVTDGRSARRPSPGQMLGQRAALAPADVVAAGPGWQWLSELYTELADILCDRDDLSVLAAPHAAGDVPGRFIPSMLRIDLDGAILPVSPELLRLDDTAHWAALAALHGVYHHELGHASHTLWEPRPVRHAVAETMAVLEEIRMESRVVSRRPAAAPWLAAAARQLILADLDRLPDNDFGSICLATLTVGRARAGSLQEHDVVDLESALRTRLGASFDAMEDIWSELFEVADDDYDSLETLAERMVTLAGADDSSMVVAIVASGSLTAGSPASGSGEAAGEDGEDGDTSGETGDTPSSLADSALSDLIEAAASAAADDAADDLADSPTGDTLRAELIAHTPVDVPVTDDSHDPTISGSGGLVAGPGATPVHWRLRPPTADEKRDRRRLAARLRKATFRERRAVKTASMLPPGRLRVRAALVRDAERSMGKMSASKPWRHTTRRSVESPRLRVGIATDVSGSMSPYAQAVSAAAWVIAGAVHDAGSKAASVAFGDVATRIFDAERDLAKVLEFTANGAREEIVGGLEIIEHDLNLASKAAAVEGPQLLIIISDGAWVERRQATIADAMLTRYRENGVKVLQVYFDGMPLEHPCDAAVTVESGDDLVDVVAKALLGLATASV